MTGKQNQKQNKPLTERQMEILAYYKDKKNWTPPTLDTTGAHFAMTRQAVFQHLKAIKRKGYRLPKITK